MTILAVGDIVSGHEFIGPFADDDAAIDFADKYVGDQNWQLFNVIDPNDYIKGVR